MVKSSQSIPQERTTLLQPGANQTLPWSLQDPPSLNLSVPLDPPAAQQATCFFFKNYVTNHGSLDTGTFDYLTKMYTSEEVGSALADSIAALGMAGLANFWKAPDIKYNAQVKYSSAMKALSMKLRDVDEAKSDQTLITTMLLGLYEVGPEYRYRSLVLLVLI
jgi:hypothetical protein